MSVTIHHKNKIFTLQEEAQLGDNISKTRAQHISPKKY